MTYRRLYTLNTDKMLFTEIDVPTRKSMLDWCQSVVLNGNIPTPDPIWLEAMLRAYGEKRQPVTPENRLLFLSTVIPQRILLSLVLEDVEPWDNGH